MWRQPHKESKLFIPSSVHVVWSFDFQSQSFDFYSCLDFSSERVWSGIPSSAMILPALWHLILVLTPLALSDNNPNNTVSWFTNGENNINFARLLCRSHNCQIVSENVKFLTRRGGFTHKSRGWIWILFVGFAIPGSKLSPLFVKVFVYDNLKISKLAVKKPQKYWTQSESENTEEEARGIQPRRIDAIFINRINWENAQNHH